MAPPNNPALRAALKRYTANAREEDTVELLKLFGDKKCTVLLPVRVLDPKNAVPEMPTFMDPVLGPLVHVHTMRGELPKYNGVYTVLTCTVLDLIGDLLEGRDVGVVFDPEQDHAVYFRFNGPQWVVRSVKSMRTEARASLN